MNFGNTIFQIMDILSQQIRNQIQVQRKFSKKNDIDEDYFIFQKQSKSMYVGFFAKIMLLKSIKLCV